MKLKDLKNLPKEEAPVTESRNENSNLNKAPAVGDIDPLMTTAQAAKELGVTQSRIRQFIMDGRLKAKRPVKGRRDNMLSREAVRKFKRKDRKITGRPEGSTSK